MLKNKVKQTIQKKLHLGMLNTLTREKRDNKYEQNVSVSVCEANVCVSEANETNETNEANETNIIDAFIEIPNYLLTPSFMQSKPILVCMFQISIANGMFPFILYLLSKSDKNKLDFIHLSSLNADKRLEEEEDIIDYLYDLLQQSSAMIELSYAGFSETKENIIVFVKYVSLKGEDVVQTALFKNYFWATTHELINLKTVITIPIAQPVTDFFLTNPSLLHLKNAEDVIYTSPMIGYYKAKKNKPNDDFIDVFKEKINDEINGFYYSFSCDMPIKNTDIDSDSDNDNNTLVMRAALFLKQVSLNNDSISNESIFNDTISNSNSLIFNTNKAKITYAIKNYNQHMPLSYHIYI